MDDLLIFNMPMTQALPFSFLLSKSSILSIGVGYKQDVSFKRYDKVKDWHTWAYLNETADGMARGRRKQAMMLLEQKSSGRGWVNSLIQLLRS